MASAETVPSFQNSHRSRWEVDLTIFFGILDAPKPQRRVLFEYLAAHLSHLPSREDLAKADEEQKGQPALPYRSLAMGYAGVVDPLYFQRQSLAGNEAYKTCLAVVIGVSRESATETLEYLQEVYFRRYPSFIR